MALIQLASTWIRGGAPDHGWIAVVIVSLGLAFWSRKSQWLLRLFSDPGQAASQNRLVMVWMLTAAVVILITGLKLGTADMDTYKRSVFGAGGGGVGLGAHSRDGMLLGLADWLRLENKAE